MKARLFSDLLHLIWSFLHFCRCGTGSRRNFMPMQRFFVHIWWNLHVWLLSLFSCYSNIIFNPNLHRSDILFWCWMCRNDRWAKRTVRRRVHYLPRFLNLPVEEDVKFKAFDNLLHFSFEQFHWEIGGVWHLLERTRGNLCSGERGCVLRRGIWWLGFCPSLEETSFGRPPEHCFQPFPEHPIHQVFWNELPGEVWQTRWGSSIF